MKKYSLKGEERTVKGRKVKRLRLQNILPANIFGKKIKSLTIQIPLKDFEKVFEEAGETNLIELSIGKATKHVLVSGVQLDHLTGSCLHVDFRQVDLKEKVSAPVPVILIGESPAEKQGLGNVVQQINEIEIEALPTDLPDEFKVDISSLEEVDQALHVKDIKYDKSKVTMQLNPEEIVVKVEPPQKEEEPTPQPEVAEAEQQAESEAPAEAPKEESKEEEANPS
jgi:large subunit ribosomal protein L25